MRLVKWDLQRAKLACAHHVCAGFSGQASVVARLEKTSQNQPVGRIEQSEIRQTALKMSDFAALYPTYTENNDPCNKAVKPENDN